MLAAEAKKAGDASKATVRTPQPPSLTGRVACSHSVSERFELVMWQRPDFKRESRLTEGSQIDLEQYDIHKEMNEVYATPWEH